MKAARRIALVVVWAGLVLSSGCALFLIGAGAAAGAGAIMYVKGELKSIETASIDDAWQAVLDTVDARGYIEDSRTVENNLKKITVKGTETESGTKEKKEIEIAVEQVSKTEVEIRIRVGTFGDETLSRRILDDIKSRLK